MRIDPLTAAGGGLLESGVYDVSAYFQFLGLGRSAALRGDLKSRPLAGEAVQVGTPPRAVIPYWTASSQLALDVGEFYHRFGDVPARLALRQRVPLPAPVRRPLGKALRSLRR
jgi:hypothetical protein